MNITVIGQAVLELFSFKVGQGITKQESPYYRNFRKPSEMWGLFHWKSDKS